ncbi:DNA-deoxyinosine glycosylase [Sphingomonas sp. TX0543]|uniref:DNA-deoxyinosine glycosylase n=1 Tax=unclassified Sphingomonas TaxID=196159 RepID=UPI0010F65C81|nr:DNA-deoxyinosine glycosylase [Sphingomonas sp. 3P27F8]
MSRKSSFAPMADGRTRLLILGSLPGERSLAEGQYYAHPRNQFWSLLGHAIGVNLGGLGYEPRLAALLEARIGLWDVVASARRSGSNDSAIRDYAANDLPALVGSLAELRAVAFNGATALRIGKPLLTGYELAMVALPSSSALHTIGIAAKQPAWDALVAFIA